MFDKIPPLAPASYILDTYFGLRLTADVIDRKLSAPLNHQKEFNVDEESFK